MGDMACLVGAQMDSWPKPVPFLKGSSLGGATAVLPPEVTQLSAQTLFYEYL